MWEGGTDAAVLSSIECCRASWTSRASSTRTRPSTVRDDDGNWVSAGSGGGNWVNVFEPPSDLLHKYVVLGTGISGSGDGDSAIYFTGGLCSAVVATVETVDLAGARTYAIDPERPIFLVGIRGSGRVRIVDKEGHVVEDARGERLEFMVDGKAPWDD